MAARRRQQCSPELALVLASVCLAALATGASAQCTAGNLRLNLVRSTNPTDELARCLNSARVTLYSDCKVSLTGLDVAGNYVRDIWTGNPSKTYESYVECPLVEGTRVTPQSSSAAHVNLALAKAFEGHVYGYTDNGTGLTPKNPMKLAASPFVFTPGYVAVNQASGVTLEYAIVESNFTTAPSQISSNATAITACSQLPLFNTTCLNDTSPDGIASPCPAGRQGLEINAYLKVCALCPAGSYSDSGHGCTSCEAGYVSNMGAANCTTACVAGTFAGQGSSTCLPCPQNTYSNGSVNAICAQCPANSFSWIPGSSACVRCVKGVPVQCVGDDCGTDVPSPGSHIVTVGSMQTCNLTGDYEVKAWTKCTSWAQATPTTRVQFALVVSGDCSIEIQPIVDPTCADPTSSTSPVYGAIQMRAYYRDATTIRSLLPSDTAGGPMLSIESANTTDGLLTWSFFAASADPAAYNQTNILGTTCVTLSPTVVGGQVAGEPSTAITQCPIRSYSVPDEYCYPCPTGSTCPGATGTYLGPKALCSAGTYNPYLGGTPCLACPAGNTSYAGATQCDIIAIDKDCFLADTGDVGMQYDPVSQTCQPCPPGTRRNETSKTCVDCPAGYYSGRGAANCTICPAGQYNPTPGLADQANLTGIAGQHCFLCARGSLSLSGNQTAATVVAGQIAAGATFCDACPAGFVQDESDPLKPCVACKDTDPVTGPYTYRTGDATPENNECVKIPSGYTLKNQSGIVPNTEIELCPPGTVSFWSENGTLRTPSNQFACIDCAQLQPAAEYVHTYAPHAGMIACIECPAGTVPLTTVTNGTSYTASCVACPNGYYRNAYTKSKTCTKCDEGKETGRSGNKECSACRPGTFMNAAMVAANASFCAPCAKNYYKASMAATSCTACPRGYATQDTGNVECYPCPVGYFSESGGDCRPAPAGTFVNITAAFFFTACPEGTYNDEAGLDNCNSCAPGRYANTIGSTECRTCAAGTYSRAQATTCIDCRAGYSAPAGSDRCHPCKPGTYSFQRKSTSCLFCPKGFQCPTAAMTKPAACPKGTFSNKEGQKLCTPCPINTISQGGGTGANPLPMLFCTRCPVGYNTRGLPGQSRCHVLRPQVRRLLSAAEQDEARSEGRGQRLRRWAALRKR